MTEGRKVSEIISAVTVFVLFAVILSLVVFTAGSYRAAGSSLDSNENTRAVLSYIVNCVRESAADGKSDIFTEELWGTEILVIRDEAEGFEQRFYGNDGRLLEEYVRPDAEISPEDALEIGEVKVLAFEIDGKGMLTIRTDAGSSCVSTRRAGTSGE